MLKRYRAGVVAESDGVRMGLVKLTDDELEEMLYRYKALA